MTKKNLTLTVAVAIITIALIALLFILQSLGEGKKESVEFNPNLIFHVAMAEEFMKEQNEINKINIKNEEKNIATSAKSEVTIESFVTEEEETNERPHIEDIPLSEEILDYTYELATSQGVAYELVLAIMKTESGFDEDVVSATKDYGILQINKSNIHSFAKAAGISNVDPLDAKDNIAMGIYYLSYLKEKYLEMGFSEEDTYFLTILGFNRGESGALKYIRKYGWTNSYVTKVSKNKELFEVG